MNYLNYESENKDNTSIILSSVIIVIFSFIISLIYFFIIRNNSKKFYLSIRSPNILHLTNITIFICVFIISIMYIITDDKKSEKKENADKNKSNKLDDILGGLFVVFHFITYFLMSMRYLRLYLCSDFQRKSNENDLVSYKHFSSSPMYYEYMYIRIALILLFLFSLLVIILGLTDVLKNPTEYEKDESTSYYIFFWTIILFAEHTITFIVAMLLFKIDARAKIKLELILHFIIILACNLAFYLFFFKEIFLYTCISNYLLEGLHILFPFYLCHFDMDLNTFGMTEYLCKDLYIFLSNEKCYDCFVKYLHKYNTNFDEKMFHLNFYIEINKFKLENLTSGSDKKTVDYISRIYEKYFIDSTYSKFFDKEKLAKAKKVCEWAISKNRAKDDAFDGLFSKTVKYLKVEFDAFRKSDVYYELITEIRYLSFLRSKLLFCGLIQN